MKFLNVQIFQPPVTSSLLHPNILFNILLKYYQSMLLSLPKFQTHKKQQVELRCFIF